IHAFHGVKEAAVVCGENVQGGKYIAAFVHFDNTENSHINSEEVAFKADHKPSNADNKEKHIPPISDDDSYHTSNNSHNIELLRLHLSKTLPSYMIPTYIIEIDRIPITHNGKIDRKQLLAMVGREDTHYTAPRNKFEEELTKVWGQILGMERISINDDFFVIGGDDEIAFRLSMELQKRNITMNLSDVRLYPTIEKLVDHLKYEDSNLEQQDVTGNVELTPIQRDFFERNRNNKDRWNQAFCLFREEGFDVKLVRQVFQKITEHHDALRLRYIAKDSEVVQYHTEINENAFTLEEYNYSGYDNVKGRIQEVANRMQGDINIMNGPLLKLGLFRTKQGDHLLIIIHHLVVDGVSWRIILEDFTTGYKQLLHQELIVLTPKTHLFQYWAEQLKRYSSTDKALKELTYWEGITHANNERLKKDGYVSTREFRYMQSEELVISKEETIHLLKQVHRAYGTQTNEILLAILGLTLKDWFGLEKVLINLEGHGREEIIDDVNIKRTVGWFTSFYPVILDM
ncbi:MAG TPA: condensation domain-containing protein, partial [Lachnospiraceae bacterium]|nr:condensation domain-containing protein [Lachnospiraceae bacterium]